MRQISNRKKDIHILNKSFFGYNFISFATIFIVFLSLGYILGNYIAGEKINNKIYEDQKKNKEYESQVMNNLENKVKNKKI